jgi:predicted dehydrogenase
MEQIMLKFNIKKRLFGSLNWVFILMVFQFCNTPKKADMEAGGTGKVVFMSLDPGHFHAGLIHMAMYPDVDSSVYVFAPDDDELKDYLKRLEGYNTRTENPTAWNIEVNKGSDYFNQMIKQKPGNVMMVAGKNDQKIDYILGAVQNGIHVYADKPLVIDQEGFGKLQQAFAVAREKDLLLYDIMTERFEITSILQKELSMIPEVFGELVDGTLEEPAITKESVHHFFKYVSGQALIRPDWFFDVSKQGEGLVDVTTHLVDLIQWAAFPEQVLKISDVEMIAAKRWSTPLSKEQFQKVTGKAAFPEFLNKDLQNGQLQVYGNGEMHYTLGGKHAKVSVIWNFQAPEGGGDTHFSVMRGTKANLVIQQGESEAFIPTLYVELLEGQEEELEEVIHITLQKKYPGLGLEKLPDGRYLIKIPDRYHVGHEAHFAQVTEKFLEYFQEGKMPDWEVPNMLVKYFTTTKALEMARQNP